jgi:hypothetical protein
MTECPMCGELELRETNTIEDDVRNEVGTEMECRECHHYEVYWRKAA